jgi:hypothetical protein
VTSITFQFNKTKAVESILYLAQNIPNVGLYNICKLLYNADKISLNNYGRFIFGESYVAMGGGGTPSNAYNLLKRASSQPEAGMKVENNHVIALRDPDLEQLSDSDIRCLDQVISKYGGNPIKSGRDAHDEAYYESWNKRGNKRSIRIPVENIARLFPNSTDLIDYLANSDPL